MTMRMITGVAFLVVVSIGIPVFAATRTPRTENNASSTHRVVSKLRDLTGTNLSGKSVDTSASTEPQMRSVASPQAQTASATSLGPNLIQNGNLETTGSNGLPSGFSKGGYGTNTRTLTYPVSGNNSTKGAQVTITSYTNGDAKWYFPNVSVTPGATYQFSDYSSGNVPSIIDIQYKMSDGTFTYADIANVPASGAFQQTTKQFTVPANVASLTIFHLINRVGTLTVDDYSLNQVSTTQPPPPPPQNLVPNGNFETTGTNGLPTGWNRDHWGTNTPTFTYPVTGPDGSKAAKVAISSYTSGDAKWDFAPISVTPGVYTYSEEYSSNVPSVIDVQYQNADNSFTYRDIANLPASSGFTKATVDFTVPNGTKNITVFHLIQNVGTLTVDNVSVTQKAAFKGVFTTGAVSLRFDDGWQSQYDNAIPKMQASGFHGTFYIVTQQLSDNGFSGYMSKAEIQKLFSFGEEIGAHTRTHPDLTTLSASQQQTEIQGSRQDLLSWNVGQILSFAYPYGAYNATSIQTVKNAGFTSGAATIDGDVTPTSDPYQLEHHEIQNTTTLAQVQSWIDEAATKKLWLILTFHRVDQNCDQYCTTPQEFGQIIDYLAQKNIPVVTVSQGLQSLQ